ncbi:MAG: FAD-binding oxidoreductase, partial [Bacteroidales bacterium]
MHYHKYYNSEFWKGVLNELYAFIPRERIYTDEMRRLAWGTDASVYRMIPKLIIRAISEEEIVQILQTASRRRVGVTFRAAGTSLSGQSISDSILVVAGKNWEKYTLNSDATRITLQPGITGGRIQEILKPYRRRFSPDPASLKSAMLGGIVMNNASGMSCGTHANSDRVLESARIIFTDGTILDTGDASSRHAFELSHPVFLKKIKAIRAAILEDIPLTQLLSKKYAIKNVTGLNLLPFLRFSDPFEIIAHLMTGSEGTLAFLAEATFRTELIKPFKASALVCFGSLKEACLAVQKLKSHAPAAVELLDRKALRAIQDSDKIPEYITSLGPDATALLIEIHADTTTELTQQSDIIRKELKSFTIVNDFAFFDQEKEYAPLWALRSGIFPAAGGMREPGTSCLIEDVAFPIESLPEATVELQQLINHYGYHDGVIYGHALEGNFHFILNQRFDSATEVKRYESLMRDVVNLVVHKYNGSLKAEHGTGRNMAPFVKEEWGDKVWAVMKKVKSMFDPLNILNPGVIFNPDPDCHLKNLKPLP